MNAPGDDNRKHDDAPMRDAGPAPSEAESEEVTDANIEMNDEFSGDSDDLDLESDAGIDGEPFGGDEATDRADTVINGGIAGRSAG